MITDSSPPLSGGCGRIVLRLTLALIYWLAVVPIGLGLRFVGIDLMCRRLTRECPSDSYRIGVESFRRPGESKHAEVHRFSTLGCPLGVEARRIRSSRRVGEPDTGENT